MTSMDSIFAKTIVFLASMLAVLNSPDYIKISADSLIYDFKTGDHTPIYYYLNAENVGVTKVRFDVTSFSDWVSVYKEGDQPSTKTTIQLAQYSPLNFVLEIHPERLPDSVNKGRVTVEAVDLQTFSVIESKEVNITVNKNLKPIPEVTPTPEAVSKSTPEPTSVLIPSPSPTATPLAETPILTSSPKPSPAKTDIITPSPSPSPEPASRPEAQRSVLKQLKAVLETLSLFLKRFFW